MSIKRWAVRRDANEPAIVEALRGIGCTVGYGDWVDLIVGRTLPNGEKRTYLLEVKDGDKPKSGRKLKPSQEKLLAEWKGHYTVVLNVDQALKAVCPNGLVVHDEEFDMDMAFIRNRVKDLGA